LLNSYDEAMLRTMRDLLDDYVQDTSDLTEASLIRGAFGRLLAHLHGQPLVVIDGIPDPAMLDQFVPRATHTRLVITSRRLPPKNWPSPVVTIDAMKMMKHSS